MADRNVSDVLGQRSDSAIGEDEAWEKAPVAHRLNPAFKRAPPPGLAYSDELPGRHGGAYDARALSLDAPEREGHGDREPCILVARGNPSRDHSTGGVAGPT